MKKIFSLFILFLIVFPLHGQDRKIKWGKLTNDEIALKRCYYDTTASAVVLSDVGTISIRFNSTPITLDRHVRIKILDEKGMDKTNVELPYYAKDLTEKIISVKAQTLKIKNGRVEKICLPQSEIYDIKYNDKYNIIRFAFPAVEPGDVIEYKYTLLDKNVVIPEGWEFQTDIPTLYSEYNAMAQEGWDVRVFYVSDLLISKYGRSDAKKWILEDLSAIKEEPYCPNPKDYSHRIIFQLAGYLTSKQLGGTEYKTIALNWNDLANEFLNSSFYIEYLGKNRDIKDIALTFSCLSTEDRIKAIYNNVKDRFIWNGKYRAFPDITLNKFIDAKGGSSAEINLYLINLLRASGLDAHPVLISTKSHGIIRKEYPLLQQFNHVIAGVKINDQFVYLDATNPYRPPSLLDEEDYNEEGYCIIAGASSWVKLPEPPVSSYQCLVDYDLREPENPGIHVQLQVNNHEAAHLRRAIAGEKNPADYLISHLLNRELGIEVKDSVILNNVDDPGQSLNMEFDIVPGSLINEMNEIFTVNPFILGIYDEAPLQPGYRYLPIDFIYKRRVQQISNILLPENTRIIDIPKTDKIILKGDRMKFNYLTINFPERIQLVHDLQINDTRFMPYELNFILEVFNASVNRLTEPVVIEEKY